MASITFRKVVKQYDGVKEPTVKGIDLSIKDKEFVVLVGGSGCGKSTSLRMIAGLEDITSGEILIGDTVVNNLPPKDRDIAMVFQNYALYPHMTVKENLSFGLKLKKIPQDEIDRRVKDAAEWLEITEYLEKLPKQLSGGQRQRVALGRTMVREPKVFLMDEPLSNLDAKLRVQMRKEIKKLHQRLQTTFVYVTHDQVEAMTMADRIVILADGIIQQYDVPSVIYAKPANVFVAQFIGSPPMNVKKVKRSEKGLTLLPGQGSESKIDWDIKLADYFKADQLEDDMSIGIRPEHLLVGEDVEKEPCLKLSCNVDLTEPMGAETYLYLDCNGLSFNARVAPTVKAEVGQTVTVGIPLSKMHLFKSSDTTRIGRKEE